MDIETKLDLICRLPTEEIITRDELRELLETEEHPVAYNGFEPSGIAHLGTGLITALKVKDLTEAGCKFILFLADWHAWVNMKLGGDLEKIRKCGEYLKHVWISLGVDPAKVKFVFGTDIYDQEYWKKTINVAKMISLSRAIKTLTIAGRRKSETLPLVSYFYIPMQVADIFHLGVKICQLGMDQRKANILAREIGPRLGYWKPVCVHHHLLMGLQGPKKMGFEEDEEIDTQISSKMGKSIPRSAIFVHDSPEDIKQKIRKAYCPEKEVENPILEIVRYIIMRDDKTPFTIHRSSKHGGDITFEKYYELERAYSKGEIHPLDLKDSVAEALSDILEGSRRYFENNPDARDLLKFMMTEVEITR